MTYVFQLEEFVNSSQKADDNKKNKPMITLSSIVCYLKSNLIHKSSVL